MNLKETLQDVKGIGAATANKLVEEYQTAENIIQAYKSDSISMTGLSKEVQKNMITALKPKSKKKTRPTFPEFFDDLRSLILDKGDKFNYMITNDLPGMFSISKRVKSNIIATIRKHNSEFYSQSDKKTLKKQPEMEKYEQFFNM